MISSTDLKSLNESLSLILRTVTSSYQLLKRTRKRQCSQLKAKDIVCVVLFGILTAPPFLQRLLENFFGPLNIVPFMDDAGTAHKTTEAHIAGVKEMLENVT